MRRLSGAIVTVVLACAGCSARAADGGAPGAPLRSFLDGDWQGTGRLLDSGSAGCGADTIFRSMRVRNGRADLDYDPATGLRFSGEIAFGMAERARGPNPDAPNPATLTMWSGASVFRGEFHGDRFTGAYLGPACPRRWTMERAGGRTE